MRVSQHAKDQFRNQTEIDRQREFSDEQVEDFLLEVWKCGETQTGDQYGFMAKFAKTGVIDDAEHRRLRNWVVTCINDVMVTSHFKDQAERRRDKRRRQKKNKPRKIRQGRGSRKQRCRY
tara:strand:+ start:1093 stop:1452 length:360 start_codon:yes stop_codon:yes gene_type:complete